MINIDQLREYIIRPALKELALYSKAAEELLVGTAIQESRLTHLHQLGGGPALGFYQMEPATHADIWDNFLRYSSRNALKRRIYEAINTEEPRPLAERMLWDLKYSTIMARIHYFRRPERLPDCDDVDGLARYWKDFYNTHQGAGTVQEFTHSYKKYAL